MLELTEDLRFYLYNGKINLRGGYRRKRLGRLPLLTPAIPK